jgi:pyruvate/2-oxoglutarate dehydrogenase complex dihydrolipoamide dehydrogenase (E3) component
LYEEKSEIGGSLLAAQIPPYKGEIRNIIDYYTVELKRLNVDLHLNEEYSLSQVNDQNIDTLVLATGAGEWIPDIQGIGNKNVATAQDVLQQKVKTGDRVVVIGGGLIGLETAEFLADQGKAVIVVEMLKHIGKDIGRASRWAFLMRIVDKFKVLTLTKVIEVLPDRVVVLENNEKRNEIPTDSVVLAAGLKSRDDLQKEIENRTTVPVYSIGSGRSPGLIETAFREAFELGCKI